MLINAYGLRTRMPTIALNEGIWKGSYRHFNAGGDLIDEHYVRSICRIPDVDPYPYYQTNFYYWDDGRIDQREYPAWFINGRLFLSNDVLCGWVLDSIDDGARHTLMLHWRRTDTPEVYAFELVEIFGGGESRRHHWHWYHGRNLVQRTVAYQTKISHQWAKESNTGL